MKRRVVVFVSTYPQISETYIKNEVDALAQTCEVEIVAFAPGNFPYRSRRPHIVVTGENQLNVLDYLCRFRPDALHGHYLNQVRPVAEFARRLQVPFTIRAHSLDVLNPRRTRPQDAGEAIRPLAETVRSENCRGVLCFPFMRERLAGFGFAPEKLVSCNPIVDVQRFRNAERNGTAVMNVGAAIPKKNMGEFIALSRLVPQREFNAYALGYLTREIAEYNGTSGGRVQFIPPVDPEDMPPEYKKHAWLVYTADRAEASVGWPMALIEAMASGVAVCMQNIRPDLRDYVGDAGYLFETAGELAQRISNDPSAAERERGFAWAEQFDFRRELSLLTDLWR